MPITSCWGTCLPLFTFVYICLHLFTFAYICLPLFVSWISHSKECKEAFEVFLLPCQSHHAEELVYLCLHLFTFVYICLHLFTFVYICLHLFTFVYICLHLFTFAYICLHLFTTFATTTGVILGDALSQFKNPFKNNHALAQSLLPRVFNWDVADFGSPTCCQF
jgi:hypothetical protein